MGRASNSSTKDGTMNLKDSRVRIHQEERERIYNLKSSLDHQREPQARTGRPGSVTRRLRQAPQPGGSPASPFQSHDRR